MTRSSLVREIIENALVVGTTDRGTELCRSGRRSRRRRPKRTHRPGDGSVSARRGCRSGCTSCGRRQSSLTWVPGPFHAGPGTRGRRAFSPLPPGEGPGVRADVEETPRRQADTRPRIDDGQTRPPNRRPPGVDRLRPPDRSRRLRPGTRQGRRASESARRRGPATAPRVRGGTQTRSRCGRCRHGARTPAAGLPRLRILGARLEFLARRLRGHGRSANPARPRSGALGRG